MLSKREAIKTYLEAKPGHWFGQQIDNGNNMVMITRYTEAKVYSCEYDGEDLGDGISECDMETALDWFFAHMGK